MRKRLPLLVCLLACGLAWAYDFAGLKPEGYVSDFARVVDAAHRQQLETYAKQLQDATGVQLAVVTLPGLANEPIEDVASALFRKWGIGQKGATHGLLLLLVPGEHRYHLEAGDNRQEFLPEGYAGSVLRAMRPALRESRHSEALLAAAEELGTRISAAKGVKPPQAPAPRQRSSGMDGSLPIAALVGGLGVLVLLFGAAGWRRVRRYAGGWLPALLLGGLAGRAGGRSGGGGGFGGYDSGDSFGGFGGGDSGGSGASGSW